MLCMAALSCSVALVACSSDDDATVESSDAKFTDKSYGISAIDACQTVCDNLLSANQAIQKANITSEQEAYLKEVIAGVVDRVIVPTYTTLADNTEKMEQVLATLSVNSITQEQINEACQCFGQTRVWWERSEAFLGGAASDFSVDPTIDSWPLSRSSLLNYFKTMDASKLEEDESILGFHALEFILFRNGKPRAAAEFGACDTYQGFENITGEKELAYAQQVCKLLKERTFQLQVAWEGETPNNAGRVAVVKAAGLGFKTQKGLSYADDLKQAGSAHSKYATVKAAVEQLLSADEGSALAIANEVGTAKIANPFAAGDVSYVESPYSYRSIIDFQDNMRSVDNVWHGDIAWAEGGNAKSFHSFFAATNLNSVNQSVEKSVSDAIRAIGNMPAPFVKYCCTVHGKNFADEEYVGE